MPPTVGMIGKSVATNSALVRFLPGVSSHVIFQMKFCLEHFKAHLTLELRIHHMVGHMNGQIALLAERHSTNGTLVRLLIRVHVLQVTFHARFVGEVPVADFTLERLTAVFLDFVTVQLRSGAKFQPTKRALEVFPLVFPPLVCDNFSPIGKPLIADQALFRFVCGFQVGLLPVDPVSCVCMGKQILLCREGFRTS